MQKIIFWVRESVMCGEGISTHSVRPKTVPLIKGAKGCDFSKYLFFRKIIINEFTKETKIIFLCFLGSMKINPRSYMNGESRLHNSL